MPQSYHNTHRFQISQSLPIFCASFFCAVFSACPCNLQCCTVLLIFWVWQLLIRSSLISALFKRAIVRSLAQSLFKKEWMSDRFFRRSLQKSEREITFCRSFEKSEKAKMSDFPNRTFFTQKKERSLIIIMNKYWATHLHICSIAHR